MESHLYSSGHNEQRFCRHFNCQYFFPVTLSLQFSHEINGLQRILIVKLFVDKVKTTSQILTKHCRVSSRSKWKAFNGINRDRHSVREAQMYLSVVSMSSWGQRRDSLFISATEDEWRLGCITECNIIVTTSMYQTTFLHQQCWTTSEGVAFYQMATIIWISLFFSQPGWQSLLVQAGFTPIQILLVLYLLNLFPRYRNNRPMSAGLLVGWIKNGDSTLIYIAS